MVCWAANLKPEYYYISLELSLTEPWGMIDWSYVY